MTDDDYYNVTEGGFILRSQLDEKRRAYEQRENTLKRERGTLSKRRFEVITLYSYGKIFERNEYHITHQGRVHDDTPW